METKLEQFPDEILLIICQYLSQYHIIRAFFNLNNRLNCTISQFCRSFVTFHKTVGAHSANRKLLRIIGPYLRSLTIKNTCLSSAEISLASNIQELTFIGTQPDHIPSFPNLTDLNIITGPHFQSIDVLFLNNNDNLHSVFISSSSPLTIPILSPPKFSRIKQLAVTLQSLDDFVSLLPICPELTCLNLNLQNINFIKPVKPDEIPSIEIPSTLRIFSLRTIGSINVNFAEIKNIFKHLPSQLEHLGIEISTEDIDCVNGQIWEDYLKSTFPELNHFEFFILQRKQNPPESKPLRLPEVFKTFQSAYCLSIIPQKITGYYHQSYPFQSLCIHTEVIPTVRRRRYFLY